MLSQTSFQKTRIAFRRLMAWSSLGCVGLAFLLTGQSIELIIGRVLCVVAAFGFGYQVWKMQSEKMSEMISEEKSSKRRVKRRLRKDVTREYKDQQSVSKIAHDAKQLKIAEELRLGNSKFVREQDASKQSRAAQQLLLADEWKQLSAFNIQERLTRLLAQIGTKVSSCFTAQQVRQSSTSRAEAACGSN